MITFPDQDFTQINTFLNELNPSAIYILVDENTHQYCLPTLLGNLETDIAFEIIEIEAGEELKTVGTAAQLWEILAEFRADRNALLINLGGGVITDLGGFTASTYKRGIRFLNIPTTLLGMCDASLGGKTGVDLHQLKNMVGTFSHPEAVFIFPEFLKTLPFKELRSGFAEMLKHGLIADAKHWNDLISMKTLTWEQVAPFIETSVNIKQRIVEEDFREKNIRKTLNFGHTIGHAVESLFLQNGNPVAHGEAVALGMICETYVSYLQKLISKETADEITAQISKFFPKLPVEAFSNNDILQLMMHDKKNVAGSVRFSLLSDVGSSVFDYKVSEEHIIAALDYYRYR